MVTLFCVRPMGHNVGNDAIFLALEHLLAEAFGEVVNLISLPATTRYVTSDQAGLTARTVYEMNQYGDGVIVGGGNLYENGELEVDPQALTALEPPLMLFSLSHGRIYNRHMQLVRRTDAMSPDLIRALNERAKHSLARDAATLGLLHELGATRAVLSGCPTIFLDRLRHRLPEVPERDRGAVLVSVRNPALMNVPLGLRARVATDVRKIVDLLRTKGHSDVRLLCHDRRDISFAAGFDDVEFVYTGDVYSYLAMLNASSLNVGYRLHASLPCLAFGVPFVKISYDERALSLMSTIGFGSWNIDMASSEDVAAEVADRLDRLEDIDALRTAAKPIWDELEGIITDSLVTFAQQIRGSEAG